MTEPTMTSFAPTLNAFRKVPKTGVIFVSDEAGKRGFQLGAEGWCNLGQGQPETGPLKGAPDRVTEIPVLPSDYDYAPVPGLWELRETVAAFYNQLFRRGKKSQYSAENVAIQGGGRVAIMRACAAIAPIHLGHFLPDYTAYEELLDVFRRFQPIPILLDPDSGYRFEAAQLEREISGRGLGAIMMSNACTPRVSLSPIDSQRPVIFRGGSGPESNLCSRRLLRCQSRQTPNGTPQPFPKSYSFQFWSKNRSFGRRDGPA